MRYLVCTLCSLAFVLNGCAIAPGYLPSTEIRTSNSKTPCVERKIDVKVIEITPKLVQQSIFSNNFLPPNIRTSTHFDYRIGKGDSLNIWVWGHPELNSPDRIPLTIPPAQQYLTVNSPLFDVDGNGEVQYPYMGQIKVAGYTVSELKDVFRKKISNIIKNPQVEVRVVNYFSQKANVIGAVAKSIVIPITNAPVHPLDAISQAGGATAEGNLKYVSVKHGDKVVYFNLKNSRSASLAQTLTLGDGDIVNVPYFRETKVYVFGELMKPQSFEMNKDFYSLNDALGDAGGVNLSTASTRSVFVFRRAGESRVFVYHLDSSSPHVLALAGEFMLEPNDVVYVGTYWLNAWNRVVTQIVPTTENMFNIRYVLSRGF